MTTKFNQVVSELNDLADSSSSINEATKSALNDITTSLEELSGKIDTKVSEVTAEDIGLGNVDNTSDMDKPVSTLQAQAIKQASDSISSELISTTTGDLVLPDDAGTPIINPGLRQLIKEIVTEVCAGEGQTPYGIATDLTLGVIRASKDISVDSTTGIMTIPKLADVDIHSEVIENHADEIQKIETSQGDLQNLLTNDTTSLVNAINELYTKFENIVKES